MDAIYEEFILEMCRSAFRAMSVERRHGYLYIDHMHAQIDFVWFCEKRNPYSVPVEQVDWDTELQRKEP